jgi:hypothetical protein
MNLQELRIGNYVMQRGETTIVESIKFSLNDWQRINELIYKSCTPIPITEEWLLNFEFEWEYIESKNNGEIEKMLFKDILLMKRHHNNLWVACPYGYIISPNRTLYIHQLQNLYFALTGQELSLKNQ